MGKQPRRVLVSVLGPPCVRGHGGQEPIADPALRVVLATLLVNANQPVTESELIEAAWSAAESPANPQDALYTRISRLRTLLAPDADVTWSPSGYVLRIEPDRVDAVCFERMIEAARWSEPNQAVELLTNALAMWRGEPLQELRQGSLDHPEAIRLTQLRLRAVEDLATRELQLGDPVRAAHRLLALLGTQPHRERACGQAMWALHSVGRTAAAVGHYELLRDRLATELGSGPSSELRRTYHAVTGRPPPRQPGTVPPPRSTSFVGREPELARLGAMIQRAGIVTVVGQPGAGKTRLALEALSVVDDPVTVVPLASQDSDGAALAVAAALGVHTDGTADTAATAVTEYLIGRRQVLVLDGCEQVLYAVRALLRRIQWRCDAVTVLATSRVRLGLGGEQVLPLGPLPVEPTDPLASPSGRLFLDRARETTPDFPATREDAALAREVLRGVRCLPLAVELLAVRVASREWRPPSQWSSQWPSDIAQWCYESSSSAERELLATLTVFGGDFDVAACEAVADGGGGGGDVEDTLHRLAGARLLALDRRAGEVRYRLPDQLRLIAETGLSGSDRAHKIRERHARWCRDLLTTASRAAPTDFAATAEGVHRAAADIAAAVRWAVTEDLPLAADLTGHLGLLTPHRCEPALLTWQLAVARAGPEHALAAGSGARAAAQCGRVEEALRLAEEAEQLATSPEEHYLALHSLASARFLRGDPARAGATCEELLALPDLPDRYRVDALGLLALLTCGDNHDEARRAAADAVGLAETTGAADRLAFARYAEGEVRVVADPVEGAAILRTARAEAIAAGATLVIGMATTTLAAALVRLGRVAEAAKLLQEALTHCRSIRILSRTVAAVRIAADLLTAAGERGAAQQLRSAPLPHDHFAAAEVADQAARAIASSFGTWQP